MDESVDLNQIKAAAQRIANGIQQTPCPPSGALSQVCGMEIFCKLEYLQRTGSFKERGARNALLLLPEEQRKRGVIAASAGNHALGLAYHARLLSIPVVVVMPQQAPLTKITNCQALGARVILWGDSIEQAREQALTFVDAEGMTYIHGYDDPNIIAGQGTLGLEILEQVPDLDAILVPVGGGGLIAGISLVIKALKPEVLVIGVEPDRAASFHAALDSRSPRLIALQPTLADGLAVPCVGQRAFEIARQRVDRVVLVREHEIALSVLRLVELEKAVVEGAGATPLAACLAGAVPELRGRKVVLPLTGGNIDTTILGRIIERGLAADGRLCRLRASISDRPGGLAAFTALVAKAGVSIKEIIHDRAFASEDVSQVTVHCVVETRDREHGLALGDSLRREGYRVDFQD